MSSRLKWLLAALLALGSVVAARAALQTTQYVPLAYKNSSVPTPAPTPVPGVFIIAIEADPESHPLDEYVDIRNQNRELWIFMENWILRDDSGAEFKFPRLTLFPMDTVRVWTKAGQKDPENVYWLYWGRDEPVWNDRSDCAYLRAPASDDPDEDDTEPVDSFCYP